MLGSLKTEIRTLAFGIVLLQAANAIVVTVIIDRELSLVKERQEELEKAGGGSGEMVLELAQSTTRIVESLRELRRALDLMQAESEEKTP